MTTQAKIVLLGHSTLAIDIGGTRVLTDPVLRGSLAHLRRVSQAPPPEVHKAVDLIVISHIHHDHLDLPSLKRVQHYSHVIAPVGAGELLRRNGHDNVVELLPSESFTFRSLRVTATIAQHSGRRLFGPKAAAVGYTFRFQDMRIYFAGDTALFQQMQEIAFDDGVSLTAALLPVAGWSPKLGWGHMDPASAAEAVRLLNPKVVIPIHWGTFAARVRRSKRPWLTQPPYELQAALTLADVGASVVVLTPGEEILLAS